jgi:N-acylneuraminate cytidylyltransferase
MNKEMNITFDNFISLPCTSPLRHVRDIDNAIKAFCKQNPDLLISVTESNRNPYFNMVSKDENGFCKRVIEPDEVVHNRQNAKKVWDITTVIYISNREYIMSSHDILSGKVFAFDIPCKRSLDIDTELDFKYAEYLIKNAKG